MTALTAGINTVDRIGKKNYRVLKVAASQKLFYGALIICDEGYAKESTGLLQGHFRCFGVARGQLPKGVFFGAPISDDADNSTGNAGDINVLVEVGEMTFVNGAGANALSIADIGSPCYALDDNVVGRDSGNSNRAYAGIFQGLTDDGRVKVTVGETGECYAPGVVVRSWLANADLSSLKHTIVALADDTGAAKVASATAITAESIGILINAPTAGLVAKVVTDGPAPCVVSSSGITAGARVTSTTGGKAIDCTAADSHVGSALETGTTDQTKMVFVQTGKTLA